MVKVARALLDWGGFAGAVVKLGILSGAGSAVVLAWLEGLNWWQSTGVVLLGAAVLPAVLWAALNSLKAIGGLLTEDEPSDSISISGGSSAPVNSPMSQEGGHDNRQIVTGGGPYFEGSQSPQPPPLPDLRLAIVNEPAWFGVEVLNQGEVVAEVEAQIFVEAGHFSFHGVECPPNPYYGRWEIAGANRATRLGIGHIDRVMIGRVEFARSIMGMASYEFYWLQGGVLKQCGSTSWVYGDGGASIRPHMVFRVQVSAIASGGGARPFGLRCELTEGRGELGEVPPS